MTEEKKGFFKRLSPLWRGIDAIRKIVLNIVFFIILILVLSLLFSDSKPQVSDSTALVVAPSGSIVVQLAASNPGDSVKKMMGMGGGSETLLNDLVDAIDTAKDDQKVKVLVLDLNRMGFAWLTKLQDLRDAIVRFKKSGKKVIAFADNYSRETYFLAAHADEIYLHQMGMVILEGYGRFGMYFREGLDKLEVDVNIFRVGKYKSAVEPFLRNDMSDEAKEANIEWMGDLWNIYLKEVAAARGLDVQAIKDFNSNLPENVTEARGKFAQLALNAKLVTHIGQRDLVKKRLIELVGEDKKTHSYKKIDFKDYLLANDHDRWGDKVSGDAIGVIVAKGTILNGSQPAGAIGGDSTAKLIRKARNDKNIKAIVFRVDSGGGSAFASEVIRRELELTREAGKPVVVSMASIAASGGFWISMASDEVWAYPSTITGSIGVFGMIPTYQKPLAKYLGTHVDGVGTNRLSGALRTDMAMSDEMKAVVQASINRIYDDFLAIVAKNRKKKTSEIHEVAQGRVWSGLDAKSAGLVDKLGNFNDALKSAAKLAKLGDDFKVKYIHKTQSFKERLMSKFFSQVSEDMEAQSEIQTGPLSDVMRILAQQAKALSKFNDPNGAYAYCPVTVQ